MTRGSPREYIGAVKAEVEQKTTLEQAVRSGDPEAAVNLGLFWARRNARRRARAAFEFAVGSGPPARAAPAVYWLGRIREERGDLDGARAAYQHAIESGGPELARLAASRLARLTPS